METDDLGGTPLHDAAEHGQMEVGGGGGGHINYNNCYTASNCVYIIMDVTLHCIIKCGMNCCISYHNCDFNTVTQALKVLVATGANPHIQDNDGLTPADLAEECGHGTCARYLRSCPVPAEKSGTQVNIVVPIRYQSNHVSIDIIVDIFKVFFFVDFVTQGKWPVRSGIGQTQPALDRRRTCTVSVRLRTVSVRIGNTLTRGT